MAGIPSPWAATIAAARKGDQHAARRLVEAIRDTVAENRDAQGAPLKKPSGAGTQFDEAVLDWLAEGFGRFLENMPLEKALGLAAGESGAPAVPENRAAAICYQVFVTLASGRFDGEVRCMAAVRSEVGRHFKVSESVVRKAWSNRIAKLAAGASFKIDHPEFAEIVRTAIKAVRR